MEISKLQPKEIWKHFEEICKIPRISKNEERIKLFINNFAENLDLEHYEDKVGNILIKKSATNGMENKKRVILQTHLDMVPQKYSEVKHNFETDPIIPYIEDGWVKAKGTTLGADNGIGVATAMAILESKEISHGPIDALFTIDEETGMTGAFGLKENFLSGDILLNLDSEDEGELYIGCAGGRDTNIKINFKKIPTQENSKSFKINIKGLKGGHSGADIHLNRANANKVLNNILYNLNQKLPLQISHIIGGTVRNAIPREASSIITIQEHQIEKFLSEFENLKNKILSQIQDENPSIELTQFIDSKTIIDEKSKNIILEGVNLIPNGVIKMNENILDLVETSTNLGVINFKEDTIEIGSLQRSSINKSIRDVGKIIKEIFESRGAEVIHYGEYPGWNPDINSEILNIAKKVYKEKYNKNPEVKAIHAGLECGLIKNIKPEIDAISFGPTIKNAHSPEEKVNIESVEKFWDFLRELLKNIPERNYFSNKIPTGQ